MKLAVITITCRPNPRLDLVARTLFCSARRAKDIETTWIIVDELGRSAEDLLGGAVAGDDGPAVLIVPPLPSSYRAAVVDRLPAHNSARNAGLIQADTIGADYVMLLNDCNVVTPDWVAVTKDCFERGLGWSTKTHEVIDIAIPDDGFVRKGDHHDLLRPIPHMSAARQCWGAPMTAFKKARGFDLAYDGQKKGNDIECALRMARNGLCFVTTQRAYTIQIKRTKRDSDVTTSREAVLGGKNKRRLSDLLRDKNRVLPERGIDFDQHVPVDFIAQFVEREENGSVTTIGGQPSEDDGEESDRSAVAQSQSPVSADLVRRTGPARATPTGDARARNNAPAAAPLARGKVARAARAASAKAAVSRDTGPKSPCCRKPIVAGVDKDTTPITRCASCRKILTRDGVDVYTKPAPPIEEPATPEVVASSRTIPPPEPADIEQVITEQVIADGPAPEAKVEMHVVDGGTTVDPSVANKPLIQDSALTDAENDLADEFDAGGL